MKINNWKSYKLGEVCSSISDTYSRKDEEVVLINTSDVLEGKILNHTPVKNEHRKGQFKKTFQQNDILYSEIRPANKRFAFVDIRKTENYIASTKLMVLRSDKSKILPKFLYSILKSNDIISELQHLAETRSGTFPQITFSSELSAIEILLPPLDIQNKIVEVLGALDDKIELNNKINNNLEQQAMALFDEYFPSVSIGELNIGKYVSPKRGKTLLSKNAISGNVPVVAGGLSPSTYHNTSNTTAPVITISASGANAGYVNLWHIPVWSSDSSFIDSSMTPYVYFWFIMLKKRQKEIFDSQTGSAQPHIYPQHIEGMPIAELDMEGVKKYNTEISPMFNLIGKNIEENTQLAQLRDTLLPKLMSGEIDVSKVKINEILDDSLTDKLSFTGEK